MSTLAFDPAALVGLLDGTSLAGWSRALGQAVMDQGHALKHGHLPGWENAVTALPAVPDATLTISEGAVQVCGSFSEAQCQLIRQSLTSLMPWRKGPYAFADLAVDSEWRSDWKWDRIAPFLQSLDGRIVLDVGCGNGYHLWRMRQAGARQVLGIDPSLLYLKQFEAIQHFARDEAVQFLPLPMAALPADMHIFDTVFSMGVLYHRRDPLEHLVQLHRSMRPGGELVLETLVIPDEGNCSLKIDGRYANMRNIYELPSVRRLEQWVGESGFSDCRTVSVETTSRREQRRTDWMPSHSLDQALDKSDPSRTIEGFARPMRAVVLASMRQ
ncbi:MAG: tRNA 5-methoxyuridine(34)/uridine 5-oxyacetic acid(34) synthase CmoB [Granulosicoccus sp.]|nr:tRNA 5-methoxyuridine(34)/uridine 5-oxyacetic acid(34) synthase CmoB [Granulosicoccus sp.]